MKIALVQYSGAGDYFQLWTKGAQEQADAAGFTCSTTTREADDARAGRRHEDRDGSGVAGIIVDHGRSPTLCPLINQAADAGIAVVVYDVKVAECAPRPSRPRRTMSTSPPLSSPRWPRTSATALPVGYVNPIVIAPLERRDVVWKQFVADHKWNQKFVVGSSATRWRRTTPSSPPALKAHPDVKAVFAPYDEVTKGTVEAIEQNKLGSKVAAYGIDISDADIELMTKKDSPWKATATTDPSAVGAAVTRALALQLAGQLDGREVKFPGVLVTQAFLLERQIKNMADLRARLPDLNLANIASAAWIRSSTF